ncbi:acyl-CoA dehydrogenase family protein [Kutzneria sp. NPDC052558]|uniref:acyl-CoA dehydrogenase family protein n=1 Tax=Kutzneria sp. NPDC052558 TaxID=3364121 RepID=UPI0037C8F0BE
MELEHRVEDLLATHDYHADRVRFRGAQFDAGLAWAHFPVGLGGLGLDRAAQAVIANAFHANGIPPLDLVVNPIGLGMAAPTLREWAAEQFRPGLLRRIFTGEDVWCQMFSEPGAGSDIAGVATRAVRDGDDWVITGQKVWTTLAHRARYGLLLARTDPTRPKHRGLSYFFVDMRSPGIEVRPLYQLTGEAEFNEVFLDQVRVPAAQLLGAEGDGWRVAITTLANERAAIGGADVSQPAELLDAWRQRKRTEPAVDAAVRDRVLRLWVEAEAVRLSVQRAAAMSNAGVQGPEGAVAKLASAEMGQRVAEAILDLQGPAGLLHPDGYPMRRAEGHDLRSPSKKYLRTRAFTIEGGTSEMMRTTVGERILGLPGEVRLDKDVPWNEIPR